MAPPAPGGLIHGGPNPPSPRYRPSRKNCRHILLHSRSIVATFCCTSHKIMGCSAGDGQVHH